MSRDCVPPRMHTWPKEKIINQVEREELSHIYKKLKHLLKDAERRDLQLKLENMFSTDDHRQAIGNANYVLNYLRMRCKMEYHQQLRSVGVELREHSFSPPNPNDFARSPNPSGPFAPAPRYPSASFGFGAPRHAPRRGSVEEMKNQIRLMLRLPSYKTVQFLTLNGAIMEDDKLIEDYLEENSFFESTWRTQ